MTRAGLAAAASLAGALVGLPACGGGLPLLHGAQTLPVGEVRAEAGLSGNFAVGDLGNAVSSASADEAALGGPPTTPGSDATFAKGAIVEASTGPGLAPIAGARVGIPWQSEGGSSTRGAPSAPTCAGRSR